MFLQICELACPRNTRRSVFDVIAQTHVCRRWRDTLLSYPLIWSYIYVKHNSPESLIAAELERSQGVPLTVNIRYSSCCTPPSDCGCIHHPAWEFGDSCPHISERMPSLEFLEPFRTRIHTLNVRYLRNGDFVSNTMEDIINTPFFFGPFPNLESLRWSCRYFGRMDGGFPMFMLPEELFGSSLPRLQKLSMIDCWGLGVTDTPALKAMSLKGVASMFRTKISAEHLINWLRRRQSLVSLSLTRCRVVPDAESTLGPVSMKKLKELVLRNVDGEDMPRYIRCPSIGRITTLRVAPFTHVTWADSSTVSLTATDGLGGSISILVSLTSDMSLVTMWRSFTLAFQHLVTTLEVEEFFPMGRGVTAVPRLIDVLPDLHTIKLQRPDIPGLQDMREILSHRHSITRVERLACEAESPDEARRKDEIWKAICAEYKIYESLA